jgi:glucose 1-dehydrogenase
MNQPSQDSSAKDPAAPADPGSRPLPNIGYPVVLTGQPALVTGANSGIGKAVALGLARAGADVVVNYVTKPQDAEAVAHEIEQMGRRAIAIHADVSNEEEVDAMFAQAIEHFGTLHVVVSNAGLQRDSPYDTMTLEQWNTVIGVNLTGQFLCTRAAAREFKRRGVDPQVSVAAGKILCMSSVHQEIPWAGHANYAASKGGIMMLMRPASDPRQQHRAGRDPHAHQHGGVEHHGGLSGSDDVDSVQTHRRARRHCPGRGLAGLRCGRLRHRRDVVRRRRDDALPRLRHRWLRITTM